MAMSVLPLLKCFLLDLYKIYLLSIQVMVINTCFYSNGCVGFLPKLLSSVHSNVSYLGTACLKSKALLRNIPFIALCPLFGALGMG